MRHQALLGMLLLVGASSQGLAQGALRPPTEYRSLRDVLPSSRIEGPAVLPGDIATSPISISTPSGAKRAHFTITPMPGVRMFSDTLGDVAFTGGDSLLLPITYSLDRTRASGLATIARIVVHFDDESIWSADFEARVRARHALRIALTSETGTAYRGRTTSLRFLASNQGNAADTVSLRWNAGGEWQLVGAPTILIVPPGETWSRTIDLRCPSTAATGEVHIVQVSATGRGTPLTASAILRVAYRPSESPGFVEAPTTLFLGSATNGSGGSRQSLAITSRGELASDMDFTLTARYREPALSDPVFSDELGGQAFRLGVRRRGLSMAIGDVWQPGSAIPGLVAQGRGGNVAWRGDALRASALVARPLGGAQQLVAHADASRLTRWGWLGVSGMQLERAGALPGDTSTVQSAGLTFARGDTDEGTATLEMGMLRLREATGSSMTGFALDGSFARSSEVSAIAARLHVVPASPAASALMPTSMFLSGSRAVRENVRALGSASITTVAAETGQLRAQGVSAGASVGVRDAQVTVMANLRSLHTSGADAQSTSGGGASVGLAAPVWRVTLDGYAEHGAAVAPGGTLSTDLLRGGVRWAESRGWLWAGVSYARGETGDVARSAEVSGAYRFRRAEIQGGTNTVIAPEVQLAQTGNSLEAQNALQVASFWSRISMPLPRGLAVVAGTSYQPSGIGSAWRFSLGVRQRLDMPLPIHRPPVAQGFVYEDRNGDRRWQEGEPTVGGVAVTLGYDRVITGLSGAFAFEDPALRGQTLALDAASIPPSFLLPPDAQIASVGRVSIPLVRAAALTLALFTDVNGDSLANDNASLPEGLIVSVVDHAGRTLDATPNGAGEVIFKALLPGRYTVTVLLPNIGPRAVAPQTLEIELAPGAAERRSVPLPSTRREVRFNNG